MENKKRKDQFVVAYLPCARVADCVTAHALQLAEMLKKGVILLHVADSRYGDVSVDEAWLKRLQNELNSRGGDSPHTEYCLLRQPTRKAIAAVGEVLNGVAVVAAVDADAPRHSPTHYKEVLRNFRECKTAYLTVQTNATAATAPCYDRVAFFVDYSKESKEKLIWASYFARFNKSRLELFHYCYRDSGLQLKWHNNMRFLDKLFKGLDIGYCTHAMDVQRTLFAETAVVDAAAACGCRLLISTTTDLRNKDLLDYLLGSSEQHTVRNNKGLPVLFINPRDDLYVLCD
ncbi:MAG: hypothetical protein AUK63_1789 [bacterium P3]|nr:MAG: hypothetical protein AUK63_1789 [bacterium P3]KWW38560.1 MAG: hypothetical protein F083_2249 [bacterium F083]